MTMSATDNATGRAPIAMIPTRACWICGSTERQRVWRSPFDLSEFPRFGPHAHADHPDGWLVRCRSCGFGQAESLPAGNYFDVLYDQVWTPEALDQEFDIGYKDFIFRAVLAGLERRLADGVPRTLLDVGTHVGRFPHLARQAGWEAEGAELNPHTADYARRRTGLTIHQCRAQELAAQGRRYGAIVLTDVLEHIPDPAPLVAELRGLLHPGGVIAVKVPHGPMQILKEKVRKDVLRRPSHGIMVRFVHVNHFSAKALRRCLRDAGFRGVSVGVGAPEFWPAGSGRSRSLALSALMRMAVYRTARLIPGGVHTPLSLHLQAFGVNPRTSEAPA